VVRARQGRASACEARGARRAHPVGACACGPTPGRGARAAGQARASRGLAVAGRAGCATWRESRGRRRRACPHRRGRQRGATPRRGRGAGTRRPGQRQVWSGEGCQARRRSGRRSGERLTRRARCPVPWRTCLTLRWESRSGPWRCQRAAPRTPVASRGARRARGVRWRGARRHAWPASRLRRPGSVWGCGGRGEAVEPPRAAQGGRGALAEGPHGRDDEALGGVGREPRAGRGTEGLGAPALRRGATVRGNWGAVAPRASDRVGRVVAARPVCAQASTSGSQGADARHAGTPRVLRDGQAGAALPCALAPEAS